MSLAALHAMQYLSLIGFDITDDETGHLSICKATCSEVTIKG